MTRNWAPKNNRNLFSHNSRGQKSKTKVPEDFPGGPTFTARAQPQSLMGELRSCKLSGMAKKKFFMKKNNKIKGQEGHAPSEDSRAGSFFSSPGAPGVLWLTAASLCKPGPLSVCRWLPLASYACQCRRQNRLGFDPQVGKICWRRKWQPTPVYLPGESHGPGGLQSTGSHRVGDD